MVFNLWEDEEVISPAEIADAVAGSPADVIALDDKFQMIIDKGSGQLKGMLEIISGLNHAVWDLADYVPANLDANPQRAKMWKETLKPQMTAAVVQDVRSVSAVVKALSAIRNFGLVVNTAGNNVMKLKGSAAAIDIAKKLIPKELENIQRVIETLNSMELQAITMFQENAKVLLEIAGPKAADFAKQEAEIRDLMDANITQLDAIADKTAKFVLELERYTNLIVCTKRQMNDAKNAVAEAKARASSIDQLVNQSESNLNAVPETVTEYRTQHHSSGWWIFRHRWTTTTAVQVANPNRDAQRNYYQGIIQAREARLRSQMSNADAKVQIQKELEKDCAQYEAAYKQALQRFEDHNNQTKDRVAELMKSNNTHAQRLNKTREEANLLENEMGLKGSALLDCLAAVRQLSKGQGNAVKVFAPLVSVLEAVTKMSEANVMMIESDDNAAVYLGGKNLLAKSSLYISMYDTFQTIYEHEAQSLQAVHRHALTN